MQSKPVLERYFAWIDEQFDKLGFCRAVPFWVRWRISVSARHVGIVQSLLAICRLHDINPYDYFVDVPQRVGQHPAFLVHQRTPRIWKAMFANNPLRWDLHH